MRKGDWKLIRFFADNDDGSDRFELYNLKDDVGESKNLAADKPELVRELNELITGFLRDTEAVVPNAIRTTLANWQAQQRPAKVKVHCELGQGRRSQAARLEGARLRRGREGRHRHDHW